MYSETRWFLKYDVLEILSKVFPDLMDVMIKIGQKKVSPANTSKLLKLLLDIRIVWQLKIELAAYIEGMFDLQNLTYYIESEASNVPFLCGARIDVFLEMFPQGYRPFQSQRG